MNLLQEARTQLSNRPLLVAFLLWVIAGGLVDFLDFWERSPGWVISALGQCWDVGPLGVHDPTGQLVPTGTGRLVVVGGFVLLFAILAIAIVYARYWIGSIRNFAENRAARFYLGPTGEIYRHLVSNPVKFGASDVSWELVVRPNYDVVVVQTITLRAESEAIYCYGQERRFDSPARLEDANFGVETIGPTDGKVVWVPAYDGLTRKRFLIVFVPPIAVGSERRVRTRIRIPKNATKLATEDYPDHFEHTLSRNLLHNVNTLTFTVKIEAAGRFAFNRELAAGAATVVGEGPDADETGYTLDLTNVHPGTRIAVEVRRRA